MTLSLRLISIILGASFLVFSPPLAFAENGQSTPAMAVIADPLMVGPIGGDLIQNASWERHRDGWTLMVTPTSWARKNFFNPQVGDAGWAELYSKYKDKGRGIHVNLNGMKDQFRCHAEFASQKPTWDLEEWRRDVGYVKTVNEECNPGNGGLIPVRSYESIQFR
ncbi:MAG: DUF2599 domain-containing protein [Pseudonocardiaceae bacterium]